MNLAPDKHRLIFAIDFRFGTETYIKIAKLLFLNSKIIYN